jgi:type II secretory pathway pseudopilin PulG
MAADMTRFPPPPSRRSGITILEVLITIGILAIALPSALSLIPVGRSLLAKAIVSEQSALALDNACATAITSGLTNVEALTSPNGGACPRPPLVIDPIGMSGGAWPAAYGLYPAVLRAGATLSGTSSASKGPRAWPVSAVLNSSTDDLLMTVPDNADLPVTNRFTNGVRSSAGRTSWFAILASSTSGSFTVGELATLSIVVSRNRVPGLMPPAGGTATPVSLVLEPGGPAGRRFYTAPYRVTWPASAKLFPDREDREVVKKGAIVLVPPSQPGDSSYRPPRLLSLASVSFAAPTAGQNVAWVSFEGDPAPVSEPPAEASLTLPLVFLPDATAFRDYTVTIEGLNEFTR